MHFSHHTYYVNFLYLRIHADHFYPYTVILYKHSPSLQRPFKFPCTFSKIFLKNYIAIPLSLYLGLIFVRTFNASSVSIIIFIFPLLYPIFNPFQYLTPNLSSNFPVFKRTLKYSLTALLPINNSVLLLLSYSQS